jgi:hypothetical protein
LSWHPSPGHRIPSQAGTNPSPCGGPAAAWRYAVIATSRSNATRDGGRRPPESAEAVALRVPLGHKAWPCRGGWRARSDEIEIDPERALGCACVDRSLDSRGVIDWIGEDGVVASLAGGRSRPDRAPLSGPIYVRAAAKCRRPAARKRLGSASDYPRRPRGDDLTQGGISFRRSRGPIDRPRGTNRGIEGHGRSLSDSPATLVEASHARAPADTLGLRPLLWPRPLRATSEPRARMQWRARVERGGSP